MPYEVFEDLLHSVSASTVGSAFTIGVLLGLRGPGISCVRIVDPIAIVAAILISMLIFNVEGTAALVQRVMFGIAYLWFGMEGFAEFGVTRSGSSLWPLDRSAPIPQPWKGVERRST